MKPRTSHLVALTALLLTALPAPAQQSQGPPPEPPARESEQASPLPAAGSDEAAHLLGMAFDKMLAIDRGHFVTEVEEENAMTRQTGGMVGSRRAEVEGRWSGDLVAAVVNNRGDEVIARGGRMLARDGDTWKLRERVLPSGGRTPFVLQPRLLFMLLRELPGEARKVRHVERATVDGKDLVVLGLTLENETAVDFDLSGAVPTPSGGILHLVGVPGGGTTPPAETTIDLALYIDPAGGDVHRVHVNTYKEDSMPGNVQIAFAGPGGPGGGGAEGDEGDEEAGEPRYEGGLPVRKPKDDESVLRYRASFSRHGLAEMPELGARTKKLLGIR